MGQKIGLLANGLDVENLAGEQQIEAEELERRKYVRLIRVERRPLRDASDPFRLDPEYFRWTYRFGREHL